jgi:stalled ribosome rescue protein Dom34
MRRSRHVGKAEGASMPAALRRTLHERSLDMTGHNHSVVWIDHHEARIFHFTADEVDYLTVRPNDPHVHIHHKANAIGNGHAPEDKAFLSDVVDAIGGSKAILITGPGVAKTALVKYIARHAPTMMAHIAGVETVDHPADGVLLAHARSYFKAADLMSAQK